RKLLHALLVVLACAVLIALAMASLLARRLSGPLDELAVLTQDIARGRLDVRTQPKGPVEIRALATSMNAMLGELEESRKQLAVKERLQKEMEIAAKLQTSILPRDVNVPGLEIAARMIPADEVGGDYYDLLPFAGGCWIGVGDVAGHGLPAGVI